MIPINGSNSTIDSPYSTHSRDHSAVLLVRPWHVETAAVEGSRHARDSFRSLSPCGREPESESQESLTPRCRKASISRERAEVAFLQLFRALHVFGTFRARSTLNLSDDMLHMQI